MQSNPSKKGCAFNSSASLWEEPSRNAGSRTSKREIRLQAFDENRFYDYQGITEHTENFNSAERILLNIVLRFLS